jgi:predicted secreted Zn-dependent protease
MRHGFVRMAWAIAFVLLFLINGALAQGYHQLTAADFKGSPASKTDNAVAYTHCNIDMRCRVITEKGDRRITASVQLTLNRELSWLDKRKIASSQMLADVLNHEQGHYIIAYMQQQELLREISRTRFGTNFQAEASTLFDRIEAKYKQLTFNYDEDTIHSLNRVQQRSWDVYFKKRLAYMPPVAREGY